MDDDKSWSVKKELELSDVLASMYAGEQTISEVCKDSARLIVDLLQLDLTLSVHYATPARISN